MHRFVALLLLACLQGIFVSGFVPILRQALPAHASFAFAACFLGSLLGQGLVYRFAALGEGRGRFLAYQIGFGASLASMGLAMRLSPLLLVPGRFVEGIFVGLCLPLTFERVARGGPPSLLPRRVGLFNALYGLGFVVGPWIVARTSAFTSVSTVLVAFGALPPMVALALPSAPPEATTAPLPPDGTPAGLGWRQWGADFFTLTLAKAYYGFLLPFATTYLLPAWSSLRTETIMLLFSAVFITGQMGAAVLFRRLPRARLETIGPAALSAFLLALFVTGRPWLMLGASLAHAWLVFAGYLGVARKPTSARGFAFTNCLSDPGLVVGASLAHLGWAGLLPLAALGALPMALAAGHLVLGAGDGARLANTTDGRESERLGE